MLRVVCWRWSNTGPKRKRVAYTADHVNRFANMVRRNLSMPHEVVCVTDQPEGLDPSIRIVPLWDEGLREKGGCYVRLKAFSPEMQDIIGERFVSMDIDCVVTGPLDPLFDRDDEFVMWKNVGRGTTYCGSMFLMTAGARRQVWDEFDVNDLELRTGKLDSSHPGGRWVHPYALDTGNVIGSDQAWISAVLGPDEAMWTAADGVLSFKADVHPRYYRRRLIKRDTPPPAELPEHSRVVFFHGREDPSQAHIQRACPWIETHWR